MWNRNYREGISDGRYKKFHSCQFDIDHILTYYILYLDPKAPDYLKIQNAFSHDTKIPLILAFLNTYTVV